MVASKQPWGLRQWMLLVIGVGLLGLFSCLIWTDVALQQSLLHTWDQGWQVVRKQSMAYYQQSPVSMNTKFNTSEAPRERVFDWTVDRRIQAPDGVPRLMYTINGQFPGPTIQATVGDTVVVLSLIHI